MSELRSELFSFSKITQITHINSNSGKKETISQFFTYHHHSPSGGAHSHFFSLDNITISIHYVRTTLFFAFSINGGGKKLLRGWKADIGAIRRGLSSVIGIPIERLRPEVPADEEPANL